VLLDQLRRNRHVSRLVPRLPMQVHPSAALKVIPQLGLPLKAGCAVAHLEVARVPCRHRSHLVLGEEGLLGR
jgi:hypothetical protein